MTLCVYRGAVLKSASKPSQRIRTSKPMPGSLPANATKLIHVVKMQRCEGSEELTASCAGQVMLIQPSEAHVFGELQASEVKPSAIRLHVRLTKSSEDAMRALVSGKCPLPELPGELDAAAVDEEEEQELTRAAAASDLPERALFNDRSFMRGKLEATLNSFFEGLRAEYTRVGHPFVNAEGNVMLKRPASWESLLLRVPSYFLKLCGDLKGYRFSKTIYQHLMPLIPVPGILAALSILICVKRLHVWSVFS